MSVPVHHSLIAEELEKKVVITFLFDERKRESLIKNIPHQAFYFTNHQLVIKLLQECVRENKPSDFIFLRSVLISKIPQQELDWFFYQDPKEYDLSHDGLVWAMTELKKLYFNRVSFLVAQRISQLSSAGEHSKIVNLSNTLGGFRSRLFEAKDSDRFGKAIELINSPDEYIPAPFHNLAALIGGFTRKDVSAIGGKSGHNKTTFAINTITELIKVGVVKKVLYISADEPGEMIARRIIASDMRIKTSDMRQKRVVLNANEVRVAVTTVYKDRLIILDNINTPDDIASAILDNKPDITVIDHLQELDYEKHGGLSDAAITAGMSKMKMANRSVGGNLFVLSQVRDKVIDERIDDKMPRPHDFLYGSDLRRKSRELMVAYWRYKDTYQKEDKHIFELAIHKSTYSDTGIIKFQYNPEYAEFIPLVTSPDQSSPKQQTDMWSR